ncbi:MULTISPECIES: DNA-3-methyladenine glycosylase [unclassified Nitrosomonas]|jgi:DNA-3-methyladenine glycosylase II|uniref:DNA-3-methyladenine glycosylase family protein n=1 Tax=unclassified Nitrosomonas TaxID=2609265 RepID=UPI00087E9D26|nr:MULTISPECIES: DNA-3-methyladenine glycosylase [unclassified Nitrosomonas]SDH59277.1 DNA-3-methyladenine glycosylase II [Nitrosomonas sp. Nm132]SDY19353.1 DNA-3-methyladenine glycosylase II [Nitrosomonas sp. Nm58]
MVLLRKEQRVAPVFWEQATDNLAKRDPVMQRLVSQFSESTLHSHGNAFTTLARAIVGQQISVKAAASVWHKLEIALSETTPENLYSIDANTLRACGLSARKISYLQDLSQRFINGGYDETAWQEMNDEALIAHLIQIKGIGRWTAEMFLIFHMQRPDVLPLDDIGLQRAISIHYNANQPIEKSRIQTIATNWQPWRSVATWYLWRSLDPIPVDY